MACEWAHGFAPGGGPKGISYVRNSDALLIGAKRLRLKFPRFCLLRRVRRRSGRSPVDNHPSPTLAVRCRAALEVPPIRMGGCGRCTDPGLETTGAS